MVPRGKRRAILLVALAAAAFTIATSLPFLVDRLRSSYPTSSPIPSSHLLLRPPPWEHLPSPLEGGVLEEQVQGHPLLPELFVSVKTTQRFHYPRLVILLETWGTLLRWHRGGALWANRAYETK